MIINSYIYNLDKLEKIAKEIKSNFCKYKIFIFSGDLGAGKTTLIKALLKSSGINEVVQSPTFSYVNIYNNKKGQKFYHFDLYRISRLEDFYFMGFDQYIYQDNSWSFIEWPEIIMPILTHDVCHVTIEYMGLDSRKIILSTSPI